MRRGGAIAYWFMAPAVAVLGFVFGYPLVAVVLDSLRVPGLFGVTHTGLDNFSVLFRDPLFWASLENNLRLFLVIPVMTIVGLLMATLLYERTKGWRIYRSLAFVPYILAVPVVGVVFSYILEKQGALNEVFGSLGLNFLKHDWLGDPSLAIWSVALVIAWQQTGLAIVLFLARMVGIDESLYEAAMLDGASWFRRFRHITLPQLARVIEFFIAVSCINMLSWVFSYIFVMTGGGPVQKTYVMELYIYQNAFSNGLMNLASATSVVMLVVATLLLSFQAVLRRRVDRIVV